jgi:transcriptional regulator with XRE-family HTH domain
MASPEAQLSSRLRELRRRHFGPRGKPQFAARLGISVEEYERYERGALPGGELMVRICEVTGEDLQWLLTGREARQSLVISGARRRHRDFLARLANLLDERPVLAGPVEAFVDLLSRTPAGRPPAVRSLPPPSAAELIPIFSVGELPLEPPGADERFWLAPGPDTPIGEPQPATLSEPVEHRDAPAASTLVVRQADGAGRVRRFLHARELLRTFPSAFAVELDDAAMSPLFKPGDAVVVAGDAPPELGRPALCRLDEGAICRVWLGEGDAQVHLGRVSDGAHEVLPSSAVRWSLRVLLRLSAA